MHPAREGFIHVVSKIRRKNDDPVVLIHSLKQVSDLDICVAVVSVLYLRTLAEQCIGLVKKEDGVRVLGFLEYSAEVLFCLSDIFADDIGEIDFIQVQFQFSREDAGGHGFTRAGSAREETGLERRREHTVGVLPLQS